MRETEVEWGLEDVKMLCQILCQKCFYVKNIWQFGDFWSDFLEDLKKFLTHVNFGEDF